MYIYIYIIYIYWRGPGGAGWGPPEPRRGTSANSKLGFPSSKLNLGQGFRGTSANSKLGFPNSKLGFPSLTVLNLGQGLPQAAAPPASKTDAVSFQNFMFVFAA